MTAINSDFLGGAGGMGASGYYPTLYHCQSCGMLFHCSQDRDNHQYACGQQKTALQAQMDRERLLRDLAQQQQMSAYQASLLQQSQDAKWKMAYAMQTYPDAFPYRSVETKEQKKIRLEKEKKKKQIHMQLEDFPRSSVTATYKNKDFFESDGDCIQHSEYHCEDCALECLENGKTSMLPAIIAQPNAFQTVDKVQIRENFEDQIHFVKKALNLSDVQMDKIKVKDLGKKMNEAKEEITVGQMKDLIKERIKMPGFIQSFFRWIGSLRV
jgi:hypothetical protein